MENWVVTKFVSGTYTCILKTDFHILCSLKLHTQVPTELFNAKEPFMNTKEKSVSLRNTKTCTFLNKVSVMH